MAPRSTCAGASPSHGCARGHSGQECKTALQGELSRSPNSERRRCQSLHDTGGARRLKCRIALVAMVVTFVASVGSAKAITAPEAYCRAISQTDVLCSWETTPVGAESIAPYGYRVFGGGPPYDVAAVWADGQVHQAVLSFTPAQIVVHVAVCAYGDGYTLKKGGTTVPFGFMNPIYEEDYADTGDNLEWVGSGEYTCTDEKEIDLEQGPTGNDAECQLSEDHTLCVAQQERLDLVWWGVWASIGLSLVAMIAATWYNLFDITRGFNRG